ncbi:hypothetical protein Cgig2_029106 [Carnegiea gigantea]|uniref:DUF4283 domain-containing protein n=1 Tax=Carnegiea gigantea TaxID=171969 RepID=A0A9Q1JKC0_9CARY|nr:hypothetical protein Cgig2_029106 [Carnegiea gigantea]
MADPDEGTELKCVPIRVLNGVKYAKLEKEDVEAEIEYWQSTVICSVLGANPPFEIIQGYIKCIWAAYEIDKIIQIRKGVFLVRFASMQDKLIVEKRGMYFFDAKPFLVQFLDLDVKFWGTTSLSKIRSTLGIPLKTDKYTKDETMISEMLVRQQVKYEWKPTKCSHCNMFSHKEANCKEKGGIRKEWRQVQREALLETRIAVAAEQIQRRAAAKQIVQVTTSDTPRLTNPFQALDSTNEARLINSVVFAMFNYWASIFMLPNEVTERIPQICRNYMWSGTDDFKKVPYISWQHTCRPKAQEGLGIKEFTA